MTDIEQYHRRRSAHRNRGWSLWGAVAVLAIAATVLRLLWVYSTVDDGWPIIAAFAAALIAATGWAKYRLRADSSDSR